MKSRRHSRPAASRVKLRSADPQPQERLIQTGMRVESDVRFRLRNNEAVAVLRQRRRHWRAGPPEGSDTSHRWPPQMATPCLSSKPGMFSYILAAAMRAGCHDAHNELSPNLLSGASNPCMLAVKNQG